MHLPKLLQHVLLLKSILSGYFGCLIPVLPTASCLLCVSGHYTDFTDKIKVSNLSIYLSISICMYIFLPHIKAWEILYGGVGRGQNSEAITACEGSCELFSSTLRCNRRILILKMNFTALQPGCETQERGSVSLLSHRCFEGLSRDHIWTTASAVEQPHSTISAGMVVPLSPLDLICCLISFQVWDNGWFWPWLHLKHFLSM